MLWNLPVGNVCAEHMGNTKGSSAQKVRGEGTGDLDTNLLESQAGGRASFNDFPLIAEDFHES